MSAVETSTAEFDAFGPWIDEVRSDDDVPRLYRAHRIDFDSARMVLKFPRDISRRDATPQMDLYDHLLIAETDLLTLLSRTATGVSQTSVAYGDIAVVTEWANLLDAELRIDTVHGDTVVLAFNGTSRDTVVRLVDLVRGLGLATRTVRETAAVAASRTSESLLASSRRWRATAAGRACTYSA